VPEDRNFDNLVERFEKRIYGSVKGALRLELLQEDLAELHNGTKLEIFDAGCGMGQMALWFARAGHHITGCDISEKMLSKAKTSFEAERLKAVFHHLPAKKVAGMLPSQDLILMHAILEWLADPMETLEIVSERVKIGGYLSLLFFNRHGFIYRNVMHGTWRFDYILDEAWIGKGKKLTPPYPQEPEKLTSWLNAKGFEVIKHTGIRVFYDYLPDEIMLQSDLDKLLELERKYCRKETFRNMGRYIHVLARKKI